jgi:diguanylate cyclase (GGDEF)-like protein
LVALSALAALSMCAAALSTELPLVLRALLLIGGLALLAGFAVLFTAPRSAHHESTTSSSHTLAQRARTVDRLLEFAQTVQGVGNADQVFAALAHFLRIELDLAGIVVLTHDSDTVPANHVKAHWPESLMNAARPIGEMDAAQCPCLRQCLPREFKADGCPVRCGIDGSLSMDSSHPAYCVPFNLGRRTQVLVHMLKAPGVNWSDEHRQLAQTYCNSAQSALVLLHLLAEAEKQSMTDSLTGMYNRRFMEQLLEREVALAERHGHPLSVVMIDMDKFKEVNDAHGHAAGDYLLKSFAECVRMTLRRTDLAFRYGGDEFVIALPQTPLAQAQQVVSKLRQAFAAVDFSDGIANIQHQPTLSIGVAERSKTTNVLTLSNLLSAADTALYDAKSSNRDCIRIYQPSAA